MAQAKKSTRKNTGRTRKTKTSGRANKQNIRTKEDYVLFQEIKIVLLFALGLFLFVCNFGVVGTVGNFLSKIMFGLFGLLAFAFPLLGAILISFLMLNNRNGIAIRRSVCGVMLFVLFDMLIDLVSGISDELTKYNIKELYDYGAANHKGGGVIAASFNYGLIYSVSKVGTVLIILALAVICFILLTEKSLIRGVKNTTERMHERSLEDKDLKAEVYEERLKEKEAKKARRYEEKRLKEQEARIQKDIAKQSKEDDKLLRKNKKAVGITYNTDITNVENYDDSSNVNDDIHEINLNGFDPASLSLNNVNFSVDEPDEFETVTVYEEDTAKEEEIAETPLYADTYSDAKSEDRLKIGDFESKQTKKSPDEIAKNAAEEMSHQISASQNTVSHKYKFPPISLLVKGNTKSQKDSAQDIRDTAKKLQETLAIFGVEATVTDISQGPTVTRFELQPKMGTKVSRIKSLTDDIKLNLAAADIRIEAPIPGKAAIGIEVPNKENTPVLFRDLIENDDFKSFKSNLAFAVGKDIAGKNIIYDIDKFPHLLIAGATGSGKSVCINTLIMSILYKANPDDVKLVMIDPKVVELSVYNGIPHLLLPVVTDAKKAAATLNYAVNEMMERYKKFADMNTRDLAGYNRAIEEKGESELYKKLPQMIIIVDELADLIMVAKNDVEDAICRLAQLARAAGIHLIIATQRPSVDVITGLIKANMPSRIAFAVSSNTDSRTILDMGGAEELLGKGDMLFFPKGLKKPVRLQGGFVSDKEVNDVVEFLKQNGTSTYDDGIEQKINSMNTSSGGAGSEASPDGVDDLFMEAGRFIIESNKASIGMLQRKFKMGFNRAARVMDQLAEAGVVGPDEGTKPRQILMGLDQFENYIENEL